MNDETSGRAAKDMAALWKRAAKKYRTATYVSIHNERKAALDYHQRIAELKADNAQLRARVAELEDNLAKEGASVK